VLMFFAEGLPGRARAPARARRAHPARCRHRRCRRCSWSGCGAEAQLLHGAGGTHESRADTAGCAAAAGRRRCRRWGGGVWPLRVDHRPYRRARGQRCAAAAAVSGAAAAPTSGWPGAALQAVRTCSRSGSAWRKWRSCPAAEPRCGGTTDAFRGRRSRAAAGGRWSCATATSFRFPQSFTCTVGIRRRSTTAGRSTWCCRSPAVRPHLLRPSHRTATVATRPGSTLTQRCPTQLSQASPR
jgi:hypothetical protein